MSSSGIAPEYSHLIDLREISDTPVMLEPDADACRRLAGRFGIPSISAMQATVRLLRDGERVTATGRLIGDVMAQTLALAIDPFAEGPNADAFRAEHGLGEESLPGPFAALAALKKQG